MRQRLRCGPQRAAVGGAGAAATSTGAAGSATQILGWSQHVELSVLGSLIAADGITTQQNLAHHAQELNPLARPLVEHGWAGQLGASLLGYGGSLGLAYMFHQSGHHKLERFVLHLAIGAEAAMVSNNPVRAQGP